MKVTQLHLTFCYPMDYTARGILQARILEWVAVPFSRGLSNPEIEPKNSTLQEDSLPAEPPRKPKNTGVGSLSLLQWIFLPPEFEPGSPALQVDSLPAELPVKPQSKQLTRTWSIKKKKFYWSRVDLQCNVSFRYTAKWISYMYTYTHSFLDSIPI